MPQTRRSSRCRPPCGAPWDCRRASRWRCSPATFGPPRKNLDTVLRALPGVAGLHLAVVGTVAGSPYPALARSLGVAERVHFLDFRADIAALMRCADLFVFPSRYEPFGIVVLEAMNAGLPVITARAVGAADLVTPACGVVLAEADDVEGLTAALRRLAADPALRACMGRHARAAAEEHTWVRMAESYVSLYREIAA